MTSTMDCCCSGLKKSRIKITPGLINSGRDGVEQIGIVDDDDDDDEEEDEEDDNDDDGGGISAAGTFVSVYFGIHSR